MKLTCVTAVFNAIKSGNRENLIRCVRSVAALKTPHEHLIYDGGSTDGTVELLRKLEREINQKVGGESRWIADGLSSSVDAFVSNASEGNGRSSADAIETIASTYVDESGALIERALPAGVDRLAMAEKKVAEWLSGVDETTFETALVRMVEEKTAAGEYRFKKPEERELALEGARKFYREFARKIVPLSDGRYVYFAPDERAKMRNSSNALSWAEYAFHAVSSSGKLLDGKNFRERLYNRTKAADLPFLEGIIRNEQCMYRLIDAYPENDAVIFIGQDDANGRLEVITRLDQFGNVEANLGEVTVIVKHKRKENPPPKFRPLTEVVEAVAKHQAAGFSPSTTQDSIANPRGDDKGGRGESGALIERALPRNDNSATSHFSLLPSHSTLRVVSEPDTGIYNALNKGVRDAKGEWFYVLGCDDYLIHPGILDGVLKRSEDVDVLVAPVERDGPNPFFKTMADLGKIHWTVPYSHQGMVVRTSVIKRFGGFDDRHYRVCADWDFMRKCHDHALRFKYTFDPFAFYAYGGLAESSSDGCLENTLVIQRHIGLTDLETERFRRTYHLPMRKLFHNLRHPDIAYRAGARWLVFMGLKNDIRRLLYPFVLLVRPLRMRLAMRNPYHMETTMSRMTARLARVDIVSFDVFDTLLLRPFLRPSDLFLWLEKKNRHAGFAADRQAADKGGFQTIGESYALMHEEFALCQPEELALEQETLCANWEMMHLWKKAGELGKKRIIVSDMYLPREFLEDVLLQNGIEGWDGFYLSNDRRARKDDGSMYRLIRSEYGASSRILHIGDNLQSDFKMAKACGVDGWRYEPMRERFFRRFPFVRTFLKKHDDLNSRTLIGVVSLVWHAVYEPQKDHVFLRELGSVFASVAGYGFVSWLIEKSLSEKIDELLFVSRDGYLLKKICNILSPSTRTRYIYAPRAMLGNEDVQYRDYIESLGLGDKTVGVVDSCSVSHSAFRLVRQSRSARTIGFCFASSSVDSDFHAYVYAPNWRFDICNFLEFLFAAPHAAVLSVSRNGPVFQADVAAPEKYKILNYSQIEEAALRVVRQMKRYEIKVPLDSVMDWLYGYWESLTKTDKIALQDVKNSLDSAHTVYGRVFHTLHPKWFIMRKFKIPYGICRKDRVGLKIRYRRYLFGFLKLPERIETM